MHQAIGAYVAKHDCSSRCTVSIFGDKSRVYPLIGLFDRSIMAGSRLPARGSPSTTARSVSHHPNVENAYLLCGAGRDVADVCVRIRARSVRKRTASYPGLIPDWSEMRWSGARIHGAGDSASRLLCLVLLEERGCSCSTVDVTAVVLRRTPARSTPRTRNSPRYSFAGGFGVNTMVACVS